MQIQPLIIQTNNNHFLRKKQICCTNYADTVSFSGLHNIENKALFVFDLDGSFWHGTNEDIKKVLEQQKKTDAVLVYATGRATKEFYKTREKLQKEKGLILPTPDYLIANNGQFIYKNIDGELVEDLEWIKKIKETTGFDRKIVYDTIKDTAHRPEYMYNSSELSILEARDDFELRKQEDADFWDSKISYYEWNASKHMVEYFISHDVDVNKLKRTIREELGKQGITIKFIQNKYPKFIMDACSEKLIRQSRPLREDSQGAMTVLFACPADKADGIKYISGKLNIPDSEILMAGDECNDRSMADLTKSGAFFICLSNASKGLKEYVQKIKADINNGFAKNIISTQTEGAAGIVEGINEVLGNLNF